MFPFCARLHHFKNNKEQSHVFRGGVDLEEAAEKLFRRLPLRTHPSRSCICRFVYFFLCVFLYLFFCALCLFAHIHPGRVSVDLCTCKFMYFLLCVFFSLFLFLCILSRTLHSSLVFQPLVTVGCGICT